MSQHPTNRAVPPQIPALHKQLVPRNDPQRREMPLYKVFLQYDAGNDLMFIVRTVMDLTHLCRAEAMHKMWQAHHSGRSLLFTTYKERAELYQEQFADKGLRMSIEPA